jgi:hypothetical protein
LYSKYTPNDLRRPLDEHLKLWNIVYHIMGMMTSVAESDKGEKAELFKYM